MPTSESIEPNCRVLAASYSPSDQGARSQKKGNRRSLFICFGLLCCLGLLFQSSGHYAGKKNSLPVPSAEDSEPAFSAAAEQPVPVSVFKAGSAEALINKLKKNHLWEIKAGSSIAPILLASYPSDLNSLSIRERKKAFLNSLLPAALMANAEIAKEREILLAIVNKIPQPISSLTFSSIPGSWQKYVDKDEIRFLISLTKKYRTRRVDKLLKRVDTIPVSLILAQGALESSWGTSRFTREGNSLFGLWTWGNVGIVPSNRDEGKNHRVEAYDSILASLRKYTLTLNRLDAYAGFRTIRTRSLDPYKLADGLQFYSERGNDYINDIKQVISSNDLTQFDDVQFPDILVTMLPPPTPLLPSDTIAQL